MEPRTTREGGRARWWAFLVPLWILALVYVGSTIRRGWIPHDEGTLAQAADRVLMGELPHRDFDEVYTGGLSWWNAAAFRVFGTSLWSMRVALFVVFALWVPVVYWIATRFADSWIAAGFTALAVVWSVPIYTAPMPSWYVLFLATFGAAALLAHRASGRKRWLVAAGLFAGLAVLVKITGLHFAAAALLFFAWREPALSAPEALTGRKPGRVYPTVLTLLLVAFAAALLKQVWALGIRVGGLPGEIELFVLPGALIAAVIARRAWMRSRASDPARFRALFALAAPFLAGLAIPIAIFVARYALAGAVDRLVEGVLILPGRRTALATASTHPPPAATLAYLLPLLAIAAIPPARGRRWPGLVLLSSGLVLFASIGLSALPDEMTVSVGGHDLCGNDLYWILHRMPWHLLPFLTAGLCWRCWQAEGPQVGAEIPDGAFLLVTVAALVSLVWFPFTVPIYFFYFAPLLVLAALSVLSSKQRFSIRERPGVVMLVAFFVVFMLVVPMRGGVRARHGGTTERMQTARCGLDLWTGDVDEYDQALAILRARARGGYVWAGPDAPEVPFLAGLKNPTRTIFDVFDSDYDAPPKERIARLLRDFEAHGVTAVALNRLPAFSHALISTEFADALQAYFPHGTTLSKFIVVWRE